MHHKTMSAMLLAIFSAETFQQDGHDALHTFFGDYGG